ncbi:MAG TPA: TolC family protein [Terracidiphilus sp.]|nr:TolC family protein [Terracidiphilus sp.]
MKPQFSKIALLTLASLIVTPIPAALSSAQQPAPYRLTLQDAIQKALQANLNVLVAGTRVDEAEGARQRSMSAALLPRVNAETYANVQNRNLRAFGISAPGIPFPSVVGPFSNYDFRIYAQQNVIDLASYRTFKASEHAVEAGKMDDRDARDLIVRSIAALYLDAQSAAARVDAAQSRVTDSSTLLKLATDKHDAGTATGVDVLRAQVQLANDKQALLVAQNHLKLSLLVLAQNLGMSPDAPLELAEPLHYQVLAQPQPEVLLPTALKARADYLSLASQRQGLIEQQRASRARFYPKLSLNGNIGELGRSIGSVQTTGLIQGQIDFTVFDRDRNGEAEQLASRVRRIDDQIADLERGVDQDIRQALLNLNSAAEQVSVAQQGQDLAQRELLLAQDRFQAGTANNVEVVTAQDELARAQENYIVAVSSHVDAKFALARAMGDTEKNVRQFMGNP